MLEVRGQELKVVLPVACGSAHDAPIFDNDRHPTRRPDRILDGAMKPLLRIICSPHTATAHVQLVAWTHEELGADESKFAWSLSRPRETFGIATGRIPDEHDAAR
jgi:hypothetical protein